MSSAWKTRKPVRTTVYILGAIIGLIGGFALDNVLYENGGSVMMKIGFVLGLCLAYVVLGPVKKKEDE